MDGGQGASGPIVDAHKELAEGPQALCSAALEALGDDGTWASIRVGARVLRAAVDRAVDPAVLATALARQERVIVERDGRSWTVIGALRTSATPGVDEGVEFVIKAKRIALDAAHELSLVSGAASVVMRAYGRVETLAEDITSRASRLHTIVGRMIRLN